MLPTQKEKPAGLYQRYIVSMSNGDPVDKKAEYFILRLDKNCRDKNHLEACRKAVLTYANEIKEHLPELSKDLIARYGELDINPYK